MRKGYKVTLGMLTIMILLTLTVGTSYSYYSISDAQENTNNLTTTCFNVEFLGGTEADESGVASINLPNAYPISDSDVKTKLKPYTFKLTNTCTEANSNAAAKYVVTLNTLNDTSHAVGDLTSHLKYQLVEDSSEGTITELNGKPTYDLYSEAIKTQYKIKNAYKLAEGSLSFNSSKTFKLYLWIDEKAGNDIMGQDFKGQVFVYAYM